MVNKYEKLSLFCEMRAPLIDFKKTQNNKTNKKTTNQKTNQICVCSSEC